MIQQFNLIRDWAEQKGIYSKGDPKTQFLKLQEEAGELAKAILNKNEPEIIDALGDCLVVLINLSELCGYKLENCLHSAYEVIKNRKGEMKNGTFIKA
jgi:NTP pyrophosphatase (non-canonical NTP hydrolase)